MPLETGEFITDLVPTNPGADDPKSQGDDHIRLTKKVVQQSFPNVDAEVSATAAQMDSWEARIAALESAEVGGVDVGAVVAFPVTPGAEWLLCDGAAVNRTTFADLFTFLGVFYGNGNGTTTFNLPDYRGEFLRGQDAGKGSDPDAAGRTDRGDGPAGDNLGSRQVDEHEQHNHGSAGDHGHASDGSHQHASAGNHTHNHRAYQSGSGILSNNFNSNRSTSPANMEPETTTDGAHQHASAGAHTHPNAGAHTHSNNGGNETRGRNVYVGWFIHI